jgi:hypothetical protein
VGREYDCANLQAMGFDLEIRNTGVWPIDHVQIFIQKNLVTFDPHRHDKDLKLAIRKYIKPDLPLGIEVDEKPQYAVVRFKDALPPNSDMTLGSLQVRNVPSELIEELADMESLLPFVWASSDVSSFEVGWNFEDNGCSTIERLRRASSEP